MKSSDDARPRGHATHAPVNGSLLLFGIVDTDDAHVHVTTIGVTLVPFRDLAAVVTPCAYQRMTIGDTELAEYVRVVDALSATGPMVPAPPGTVFRSSDVLRRWLELHYATFQETLGIVERRGDDVPPYTYVQMQLEG